MIKQLTLRVKNIINDVLTNKEETIISLLYGLEDGRERTYEEAARCVGLSRERIRQIKQKALKKIAKSLYIND